MVEVCTVWAPRPEHGKWDPRYLHLLDLQRRSALRWGALHTTITDDPAEFAHGAWVIELPRSLMRAMIAGVIARLQTPCPYDLLFVDVDVLIARELDSAFDGTFDIGLTRRENSDGIHINNGAMYVSKGAAAKAEQFFRKALDICGEHWGADQEAISRAAAPVPHISGTIETRGDTRFCFLSMKTHNAIPKVEGKIHSAQPYVVHFKGQQIKRWMKTYADKFIFNGEVVD